MAVETALAWAMLTAIVVVQRAIGGDSKRQQQWRRRQHGQYFKFNNLLVVRVTAIEVASASETAQGVVTATATANFES